MRRHLPVTLLLASFLASQPVEAAASPVFKLQDGDRIVLLGDTLIERDQRYGYLETLLTIQHPRKNLTFRNLGWSGDTVAGLSRAGFDPPEAGFKQLVTEVHAAKPTVLLIGYGMADSFDGSPGLPQFVQRLTNLLDTLADTKARVVLLSPIAHAKMPGTSPDPTAHNADLERYAKAIEALAQSRGLLFIDLFNPFRSQYPLATISDNGIHLNALGHRFLASQVLRALTPENPLGPIQLDIDAKANATTPDVSMVRFHFEPDHLPLTLDPSDHQPLHAQILLKVNNLPPGNYQLTSDGQPINTQPARTWAQGVNIASTADLDRIRQLHRAINRKNQLFFDRWRPQNITYLFGFRKHEQGQNAIEIPQFDPLVADLESAIAKLRQPNPHNYELTRVEREVTR